MTRQQRLCLIWTQRGERRTIEGKPSSMTCYDASWHVDVDICSKYIVIHKSQLYVVFLLIDTCQCWLLAAVMLEIIYNIVMWHVLILCSVWPLPLTSCSAPAQHRTNISVTSAIICADTNNIIYHLHPSWQIYKLQSGPGNWPFSMQINKHLRTVSTSHLGCCPHQWVNQCLLHHTAIRWPAPGVTLYRREAILKHNWGSIVAHLQYQCQDRCWVGVESLAQGNIITCSSVLPRTNWIQLTRIITIARLFQHWGRWLGQDMLGWDELCSGGV